MSEREQLLPHCANCKGRPVSAPSEWCEPCKLALRKGVHSTYDEQQRLTTDRDYQAGLVKKKEAERSRLHRAIVTYLSSDIDAFNELREAIGG